MSIVLTRDYGISGCTFLVLRAVNRTPAVSPHVHFLSISYIETDSENEEALRVAVPRPEACNEEKSIYFFI